MKRIITLAAIALLSLSAISCEPDEIIVYRDPVEVDTPKAAQPQQPINSSQVVRTGKILNFYIGNYPSDYRIKVDSSINFLRVTKEWYDRAQVGYTITYQEYPVEIYRITP